MKKEQFFKCEDDLLFTAILRNNLSTVKRLLKDPNCRNKEGYTPLHLAAKSGFLTLAEYLIKNGADVNAKNPSGGVITLITCSDEEKQVNEQNLSADNGQTPLHLAVENNHPDIVKLLLENGALVDPIDGNGLAPFFYTLFPGYFDIALILIEYGANIFEKSDFYGTYLHHAVRYGHLDLAKLLIGKGIDINSSEGKETALHIAIKNKHLAIVNYLLEINTDTQIKNYDNKLPLELTEYQSYEDLLYYGFDSIWYKIASYWTKK